MTRRVAALVLPALLAGCGSDRPPVAELTGPTMGTGYSVQLSPPPDTPTLNGLKLQIDERLRAINAVFSTYLDDSDLVRFNRSRSTDWQSVPHELVDLVRQAHAVSDATAGHYDVTVGPLVDLWGFGQAEDRETPPPQAAIETALARVGYRRLEWRLEPPALRKSVPDLEVDLSSIAKGWAVDRIGDLLAAQGQPGFLVDIGGETLIRGAKSDGSPWRIAIERPSGTTRRAQGVMAPDNAAVATSGNYRNFFEHDGQRYGHTIDPRTGQPTRHRVASVTVVAEDCATADAWATALMALGEDGGPATAERLGLAALFIVADGTGFSERPTRAFAERIRWESGLRTTPGLSAGRTE